MKNKSDDLIFQSRVCVGATNSESHVEKVFLRKTLKFSSRAVAKRCSDMEVSMDYLFKPPTEMQEGTLHTGMPVMQQSTLTQTSSPPGIPVQNARAVVSPFPLCVAMDETQKKEEEAQEKKDEAQKKEDEAQEKKDEAQEKEDEARERNYEIARKHLEFIWKGLSPAPNPIDPHHWIRKITGGGPASFSHKRNEEGRIKTDMESTVYAALEQMTRSFYNMAKNLAQIAPREQELTLYRGIRVPEIAYGAKNAEIERIVSQYNDVIPSSATWDEGQTQLFASTGKKGQDAVVLHMIVPPDFPLVMLSYPRKARMGDHKEVDDKQQEVLVGASTFSDVHFLKMEEKAGYRCYYVEVKLNATALEEVIAAIAKAKRESDGKTPSKPVTDSDDLDEDDREFLRNYKTKKSALPKS